jgi:hypothetical protein
MNIREDKGYTYSPRSGVHARCASMATSPFPLLSETMLLLRR